MPNGQKSTMTTTVDKVLYTGQAHTTGGRNGTSRSSDGRLDIKLSSPGAPGNGTNPEQMFAAGWSACLRDWAVWVRFQAHRLRFTRRAETR